MSNQHDQITQTDLMQMLHKKKMAVIEKCFQQKEKGLTIEQFLKVMLQHLDYNQKDKQQYHKITIALIQLFKQIDVNGDGTMEWQQFSNHIIQLGLLRNDRSFKNMIKSYYPSDSIVDKQKHENSLESIYYFQKLKYLFSIQKDSSRFKVYNVNNANLIYQVNAHKGSILSIQYLNNQNLIATSSNDLTINFWDASSFTLKQIVSVPQIQLCVRYADWKSSNTQLLYTGGSDAIIHIYDANTLKQKGTMNGWNPFYKSDSQQYGHSGPIGDILPIDSQQTLVTAGYDGNICLWDSITHLPKKQLRGHDKGVYSLDWCDWSQMNQCLLSAGLDHEAFVWNTYVKEKIFLLRGHNHPLVGVKCLPQTPQIITADIAGMVKIWDVRNFLCMQTFNVPTDEVNSFCLTYSSANSTNMKKRIICASKKMHYFEYDQPKDQYLTDQKICLKIIFNQTLLCFITLHSDCLKVWDAKEGKLQSVYRQLTNAELTAAILDHRQRKLFVGDSDGNIFTVNIKNGARMKSFQNHPDLITGLAYWTIQPNDGQDQHLKSQRRLISCSRGTQVYIHDQDAPEDAQTTCRYVMKQHKQGCNAIMIKQGSQLLASASDDGNVIITNLISYRQQIIPRATQSEIKKIVFLGQNNCLVSCDSNGIITFYAIGETKLRNRMLFQTHYKTLSLTKKEEIFPVTAISFDKYNNLLIIGDQFGNLQGWDLSQFLDLLNQTKIQQKKRSKKKKQFFDNKQQDQLSQSNFITSLNGAYQSIEANDFSSKLIKILFNIKKAHNDGITSIQVLGGFNSFATSSFDCCCYIWSLKNYKKIGSLIIGGDRTWGLKFNLQQKRKLASQQAKNLLNKIQKKQQDIQSDQQQSAVIQRRKNQFNARKQISINNAKNLIQKQRKMLLGNQRKENKFIDAVQEAQRLQKYIFSSQQDESQDQTKNYHLLSDVIDFKKKLGANNLKKNSKVVSSKI